MTHPAQRLDDTVHQRVRLGILAVLSEASRADFGFLRDTLDLTDGNLSRHIAVLEQAGLVTRTRDAQRRPVHLEPAALEALTGWLDGYRLEHERRFRRLDAVLADTPPTEETPS